MIKTNRILHVFFILIMFSCSNSIYRKTASSEIDKNNNHSYFEKLQILNQRIMGLSTKKMESIKWRKKALDAYVNMMQFSQNHRGKFFAGDLLKMHKGTTYYVRNLRNPVLEMLKGEHFFMNFSDEIIIIHNKPTYVEKNIVRKKFRLGNNQKNFKHLKNKIYKTKHGKEFHKKIFYNIYYINPLDKQGELYLKEMKLSLASALLLLDNFEIIHLYVDNKDLRRSLFNDIPDTYSDVTKTIKEIWFNYAKYSNSKKLLKSIALYKRFKKRFPATDVFDQSINDQIETSLTFEKLENGLKLSWIKRLKMEAKNFYYDKRDDLKIFLNETTNSLSKFFGNTMGVFQSRSGKLKTMSENKINNLASRLKPLDILMEKTPFRFTDKFIPGHYGHVAMWVGTKKQLKELGVWDELPAIYEKAVKYYQYSGGSFQKAIQNGHQIIEALRPGVELNSLHHFLDIDDFVSLSSKTCERYPNYPKCFTKEKQKEYMIEAFKQLGKEYDFNFDVNTEKKIVCSELAYRAFFDIDFETSKTIGKHAISPDQVAYQGDDPKDPFKLSILYFNGKEVTSKMANKNEVFKLLIQKNYEKVEALTGICKSYNKKDCKYLNQ